MLLEPAARTARGASFYDIKLYYLIPERYVLSVCLITHKHIK